MPRPTVLILAAVVLLVGVFIGIRSRSTAARNTIHRGPNVPSGASGPADLILTNAVIDAPMECDPFATTVIIKAGLIVDLEYPPSPANTVCVTSGPAVSTQVEVDASDVAEPRQSLQDWVGPNTRVIDLHGQFVMPGFNDAHVHLAAAAYVQLHVNAEGAKSLAEFQQLIRDRLSEYQPGQWIVIDGWDHTLWPVKKFPTRQDLDAVTSKNPIIAGRIDGHVAAVNSRALQMAGLTAKTPDPSGGRIERDPKTGQPTGMLLEDAAKNLVFQLIPDYTRAQRAAAFEKLFNYLSRFGVTSVQDNSVLVAKDSDNYGWDNFLAYRELQRGGKLNVRITEWLPFEVSLVQLEQMRHDGGTTDPWLKTGALKEVLDGSLGSRTAAMLAPYSYDPSATGIMRIPPEKLKAMAIERDRVEHAQIVALEDFARFAQMNVIASMQPSHLLDDERWATDRIGAQRVLGAYAWRTFEKDGVHIAFGTDFPVEAINPLRGIYACVTRELPQGGPTGGWQPQEKLTMQNCLRDYTEGSAYAEFEETTKGKIAPGMLADLVVYPENLTTIPPADLLKLQVSMTIAGGRIVYQNPETAATH